MRTSWLVAVALVALLVGGTAAAAEVTQVKEVTFSSGVSYAGKVPATYDSLVAVVKKDYPQATFAVQGETLLVGIHAQGQKTQILRIAWQSDCPVNSQYQRQENLLILAKMEDSFLAEWTRLRHSGFENAQVQNFRKNKTWAEVVLKRPVTRVGRR